MFISTVLSHSVESCGIYLMRTGIVFHNILFFLFFTSTIINFYKIVHDVWDAKRIFKVVISQMYNLHITACTILQQAL